MLAPAIHAWAREDLAKLRAAGVRPSDDEVAWLARLAARAHEKPGRESDVDRTSPLVFCGVKFWPLTLLAETWFARWYQAFEGHAKLCVSVQLFAHAHSKPGDRCLDDLAAPNDVANAVSEWFGQLPFSDGSVADLQKRLGGMTGDAEGVPRCDGKTATPAVPSTIEDKIAVLCTVFEGTTPDYWRSDVSAASAYALAAAKQARENGDAWANSPEQTRRIADYMNAIKWIAKRGTGSNG